MVPKVRIILVTVFPHMYKALPQIIPAFIIMSAPGIHLCKWNLVISDNTGSWRPYEKIIPAGPMWGNTVTKMIRTLVTILYNQWNFWITVALDFKHYFIHASLYKYEIQRECVHFLY